MKPPMAIKVKSLFHLGVCSYCVMGQAITRPLSNHNSLSRRTQSPGATASPSLERGSKYPSSHAICFFSCSFRSLFGGKLLGVRRPKVRVLAGAGDDGIYRPISLDTQFVLGG